MSGAIIFLTLFPKNYIIWQQHNMSWSCDPSSDITAETTAVETQIPNREMKNLYKRVFCNNTKILANKTTLTSSMSLTYLSGENYS